MSGADSAFRAKAVLESGLSELGRSVSHAQLEQLFGLAVLLARWSKTINLTGHRGAEDIAGRLILDACALEGALPEISSLADIGSGAGFPGLPIAILRAERCRVTLIESRERKNHFQRSAVRELGVAGVDLLLGRAEQLPSAPHAGALAQAIAAEDALPLLTRWTEPGGLLLFLGSEDPPKVPRDISFQRCIRYRVPCGGPSRTLSIARRPVR